MADSNSKNLSRRDALKILGAAAGASVLANLPSKWKTPQVAAGVLPAHAQTSALYSLACEDLLLDEVEGATIITSRVQISPVASSIPMLYVISMTNMDFNPPHLSFDTILTDALGQATVVFGVSLPFPIGLPPHVVRVTWSFNNPSDGTGDCFKEWEPTIII